LADRVVSARTGWDEFKPEDFRSYILGDFTRDTEWFSGQPIIFGSEGLHSRQYASAVSFMPSPRVASDRG
jgi:hypothetical protein